MIDSDAQRILKVYGAKGFWSPFTYTQFDPQVRFAESQLRDRIIEALSACGFDSRRLAAASVLDVGAGWGRYLSFFLELGADPLKLQGIDLVQDFVVQAHQRYAFKIMQGDVTDLRRSKKRFDVILLFNVLSSIFDDEKVQRVVDSCASVLAPGGVLLYYDIRRGYPLKRLGAAKHLRKVNTRVFARRFGKRYVKTLGVWPGLRRACVRFLPYALAQFTLRAFALLRVCNSHVLWVLEARR